MYKYFSTKIIFQCTLKVYSAYKSTLIFEQKKLGVKNSTYTPENTVDAKLETDYQFQVGGCANLFHSVKMGNKKFIVGVVYKLPDANKILFHERREETLQLINQCQLNCTFLDDFNINLLSSDSSVTAYNNMLTSNSFFHIISVPTHVTKSSATLIDHILTNSSNLSITPEVV